MRSWPGIYRPPLPSAIDIPSLRLRESYSNTLVEISEDKPFTMYVCGITPYDATHIGHAATYLTFDLIHRFLLAQGVSVRFLENVTDIDDPLFERALRDGVPWQDLGKGQVDLFLSDMTNLRILPPIELLTVTEAMEEIIEFISTLAAQGVTYQIGNDTYLDAARVTDFSDLPYPLEQSIRLFADRGGDPGRSGKRHPLDPLLWRESGSGEPSWDSPQGKGRPGWHIECNAISHSLVREQASATISLQGGGEDLKFPHHYMTALQEKARSGSAFAEIFVHTGMIRYQGEKMSKSLGNLVFVSELIGRGIPPMAIRLALLSGHYGNERDWNDALLAEAQDLYQRLLRVLSRDRVLPYDEVLREVLIALSDNLDTPKALLALKRYVERVETSPNEEASDVKPGALSRFLDTVLGVAF